MPVPTLGNNRWSESMAFARFLRGVPGVVRRRMSHDEACAIIRDRLRAREANFLAMLDRLVYRNPMSPYRAMLELAGCELGDVAAMVRSQGLEATLRQLRAVGVGVTFEEFKGRAPIVRGGREIPAGPAAFDNPGTRGYLPRQSGGSTGAPRDSKFDLAKLQLGMPHAVVLSHIDGGPAMPRIRWYGILPSVGLGLTLRAAIAGEAPGHWLTTTWPGRASTTRFLRMSQLTILMARLGGARVPMPRHVPLGDPDTVARLAGRLLAEHGRCHVRGTVSRMVRVAVAARAAGIDLHGAILMGGAEPPTQAKVTSIRASGATFTSAYHFSEAGMVGALCRDSDDPNDQHLMTDILALIQVPRRVPGFGCEVNAFCFTSLLPDAPKVLLNTESDDYGVVTTRSCGCPWGALGLTQHVTGIRSFRKLTGEGVTLVGTDIERILEEVLPAAHGGSPLDYQLLEEEGEHGLTRVTLLVDPAVPGIEPEAVRRTFLEALRGVGQGLGYEHLRWSQAGVLTVRRESPRWTAGGKLLPLHLDRRLPR